MESRIKAEPRWTPALAILVVLFLLVVLPHHVQVMPVWVFHVAVLALLVVMAAVTLTPANTLWQRIERMLIILLAVAYIANTIVELVDMIGVITLHPSKSNVFSLLSSSVAIWVANVLTFSMLYWQIDRGGPYARASKLSVQAGLALSASGNTRGSAARLAAIVPRLSLSWIQHGHGIQSYRCLAADASRQDVDDARKHDLALDAGHHRVTRHQRSPIVEGTLRVERLQGALWQMFICSFAGLLTHENRIDQATPY